MDQRVTGGGRPFRRRGYFARLWAGEATLMRLFWFDMVLIGSSLNVLFTLFSLVALGLHAPLWAALAIHFATTPYNLFLLVALWRSAEHADPRAASAAKTGAVLWLMIAMLI